MAQRQVPREVPVCYLPRSSGAPALVTILIVLGLGAFVETLLRDPGQAWRAYVVNWLFFTSIATGAMALMGATIITRARWNWSVRRVGLAFSAFLPISFLLLLPMLRLREDYFPWIEAMAFDPMVQKKAAYLNIPFLIARNSLGLAALCLVFVYMAYLALRPDLGLVRAGGGVDDPGRARWTERLTRGWRGQEEEVVRSQRLLGGLAPASLILFAVVLSIVSFDWAMSLEPHWFSTIFGAWFFMGAFWGGVAAVAWAAVYLKRRDPDLNRLVGPQQLHGLGMLTLTLTVLWAYLFWSQYIVIWYGKLPWEQAWIILRSEAPWAGLTILTLILCFLIPFGGLLGRKPKRTPWSLRLFATVILVGLWLERYLMVVPSLHDEGPAITLMEPAIGLLFLGLLLCSVRWFLATFPAVQLWQPMEETESVKTEPKGGK